MADHTFPITTNSATKLFPEALPDLKEPWATLVRRTDDMGMTDRPANTKNNNIADAFEGEWLASRPELLRMFPTEARLVPYFANVTKEVTDDQVEAVPEGDTTFLDPAAWSRPESVPVATIQGSTSTSDGYIELNALAQRMAQTHPGSNDGNTELLLYTDLDDAKPFMTSGELQAIREIERRYFPWQLGANQNETFEISAYANAGAGVSVALERIKTNRKANERISGTATINRAIDNHSVTIKAEPGSKVLVTGMNLTSGSRQVDLVKNIPESGELVVRMHELAYRSGSYTSPATRVGLLVVKPNASAGLPEVVDKVVLDLPERLTDRIQHNAPPA